MDEITGLPRRLSPHSARHSHAALMLASGADGMDLQMQLGHSDQDMTKHYSSQRDTYRRQVEQEGWKRGQFRLMPSASVVESSDQSAASVVPA